MFTVPVTREETRAVGVLLGGSGRARVPTLPARPLAALLKPSPSTLLGAAWDCENRAAGVRSC